MGNYPPLSEEEIKAMVKKVYEKEDENFVVEMTDHEILEVVKKFLSMRKWISQGKFPLLCLACVNSLNYVGFTYKGENFLFWHCFKCHMKPNFEENQPHITFEEFQELLKYLIDQRRRLHE